MSRDGRGRGEGAVPRRPRGRTSHPSPGGRLSADEREEGAGDRRAPAPGGAAPPAWSARWYIWDGGFLALGRSSGVVPEHAHHAIQITLGIDGDVRVRPGGEAWRAACGFVVQADAPHAFDGDGVTGAMLFVDPESRHGRWLGSSLTADVTVVPERRIEPCVRELRTFYESPLAGMEVGALVRHCVESLCAGPPPRGRLDDRVEGVLGIIRGSTDLRLTLDEAARSVFLSPSRFAHLFTDHVGLPFRRYLLWRKLTRAMVEVSRGRTLAAAAHAGGFSDSAHLTRTFHQMFGIPPSIMMRGEFFEVASPFETA